jgi:hypothetical protein
MRESAIASAKTENNFLRRNLRKFMLETRVTKRASSQPGNYGDKKRKFVMKTRTGVKSGDVLGGCQPVYDSSGACNHMQCPFPPYKLPCFDEEEPTASADLMRLRRRIILADMMRR